MELSVLVSRVMVKWSNAVKSEVPMPLFSATPRITCFPYTDVMATGHSSVFTCQCMSLLYCVCLLLYSLCP